jgi:hypothetical protein
MQAVICHGVVFLSRKLEGDMAKFTWFALALVLVSSGAAAGDYSDAVAKQSKCESAGELAQSFYGRTTAELRAAAKDLNDQAKAKKISKDLAASTSYILFMGKTAKSSKDAYMQAWAWCMDQK